MNTSYLGRSATSSDLTCSSFCLQFLDLQNNSPSSHGTSTDVVEPSRGVVSIYGNESYCLRHKDPSFCSHHFMLFSLLFYFPSLYCVHKILAVPLVNQRTFPPSFRACSSLSSTFAPFANSLNSEISSLTSSRHV